MYFIPIFFAITVFVALIINSSVSRETLFLQSLDCCLLFHVKHSSVGLIAEYCINICTSSLFVSRETSGCMFCTNGWRWVLSLR